MSIFRSPFTLTRKTTPDTLVNGKMVAGSSTTSTIQASVQPLRGQEMMLLPEARRTSQAVVIYTDTQLRVANTAAGYNADVVTAFGQSFEILSCEPWQSNVINHYRAIGVKK